MINTKHSLSILAVLCGIMLGAVPALAQDVLTVGSVTTNTTTGTVTVPVYLRDVSGTPLGLDQPAGRRITGLAFNVKYGPGTCITNSTVLDGASNGLIGTFLSTASCGSTFVSKVKIPGTSQAYIFNAPEGGPDPCGTIPFNLNAPAPGDKIVELSFTLSSCPLGITIPLTVSVSGSDEATLNSDSGTVETVANGGLQVVNGQITIPAPTVTLTPDPLNLVTGSSGTMTVTLSFALSSNVTVTLASANPAVASVPASVTILAGATSATFAVNGVAAGSTTVTASLPASAGGATATATVNVAPVTVTLSPDPLNLTVGGTGNMTVTINPVQSSNTVITLVSSDSSKATVPASVTIPANQASAQFPVSAVGVGSATITATLPAGLGGGSDTATVNVAGITVALSPDPLTVAVGGSGQFTVALSAAQPTPTTVTLVSSNTSTVTVPASVTVPAGSTTATFNATGVAAGTATVTATLPAPLGGSSATATVNVVPVTLSAITGPSFLQVGQTGQATIILSGPAPAGGITINLAASPGGVVSIPASVTVPAGQTSVQFNVTGVAGGSTTVSATFGSTTLSFAVTVVEPIPTLSTMGLMVLTFLVAAGALFFIRTRIAG